ncbi:MAG TPA: hypothetical protein DGT21_15575 [Armatimonadetes bacterium]|jgi:flagellar biosynthesis protein FliR|nr:hypothetical protein [Armatimonadota bacterium]
MELLGGIGVALWGLVFARVAGVTLLVPPVGVRQIPALLRLAVAAVIAVPVALVAPPVSAPVSLPLGRYIAYAAENLALGLTIGGFVAAVVYAAAMAGAYMDRLGGWGSDAPQTGPISSLFYLLAAAGFVLTDGHLTLVDTLVTSLHAVGPLPDGVGFARQALLLLPAKMFASSLAIAGPALLALLVCRAVVAATERISVEVERSGLGGVSGPLLGQAVLVVALPAVVYVTLWQLSVMLQHLASAFS